MFVDSGTTYAEASKLAELIGGNYSDAQSVKNFDGVEALAVRKAAESSGKNVDWAADRLVLIYEGIPVMFGYSEISEIKACLDNGGDLFE